MARLLSLDSDPQDAIRQAADILSAGGLVAVPTETVYGLAADATDEQAVAKLYAAKGRPSFNPLIAHVSGLEMAERFGVFDKTSLALARRFWPGPLTIVLPLKDNSTIAPSVTAGLPTIALRHPLGPMATLAGSIDRPLAAPSANTSGRVSPTRASHVLHDLGDRVDLILDDGDCDVGLESTILRSGNGEIQILRDGGIPRETLAEFATIEDHVEPSKTIQSPGQMLAHYAPSVPLYLDRSDTRDLPSIAYVAFGDADGAPANASVVVDLSAKSDQREAAHNLFATLQELDRADVDAILVAPIPEDGLGAAINDRLRRARHGSRVSS